MQEENPQITELSNIGDQLDADASIIDLIVNAPRPHPSTTRIHTVPSLVKETDYEKYFVPNQVSIGPKYFGHPKLQLVEKLKPSFAMKLLLDDKELLERLCTKL
ncbi:hypothetical protein CTI12_AA631580 [Artemisia annua]|uniref:Uncharacterized protein n=1 Tax=Artemisia annua TaxID=35608 RepID=A0A2U1K8N1_ARTAN|nr:hypothetical protein CTI12_AA631580 [Artemisia annua]